MYPYHNAIRQRIRAGELRGFKFVRTYNNIGPCILLLFNTYPNIRPIRPYRFREYERILIDWKRGLFHE